MTTINLRSVDPATQLAAILANPVFIAALTASPAQIDAWLNTNVTTLAQARPVLSMLMQSVAYIVNEKDASTTP